MIGIDFLRRVPALPRKMRMKLPRVTITLDVFDPRNNRAVVLIVPLAVKTTNNYHPRG